MKRRGSGSKQKGSSFERLICKQLSLWITRGKKEDCFWRSAMSGGRATVAAARGKDLRRQAGDICAISPEGHALTDRWYIECKNVRDAGLAAFLVHDRGPLSKYWRTTCEQAERYQKSPLLIMRQFRFPTLAVMPPHWAWEPPFDSLPPTRQIILRASEPAAPERASFQRHYVITHLDDLLEMRAHARIRSKRARP